MKKLLNYLLAAATLVLAACGGQNDPEQWTAHWENGKLPGKFSISANKQVSFSQGNLQYQASTSTWRFALHQYDFIGKNPGNTTATDLRATQADWIDLFGWGTSGFMNQQPYSVSQELRNYGTGANSTADLTGTYYDWGRYNAITNGGDRAGLWRTLNYDEWKYILRDRPQADDLRGQATINNIGGYIILPDDWEMPEGLDFKPDPSNMSTNVYTFQQWSQLERAGALFLPFAGSRNLLEISNTLKNGGYATASMNNQPGFAEDWGKQNYYVSIGQTSSAKLSFSGFHWGRSVRLAQDVN